MTHGHVDALVVVAIQVERRAVREHLSSTVCHQIGSAVLDVGDFFGGSRELRVAILEVGPGNVDAAALTGICATELKPTVTMMVGIAGAVKDLELGDVVASSKVYWAESGKSIENTVRPRPSFGPVSMRLVQTAMQIAADDQWQLRIKTATETSVLPKAIVAPIVAGERVVADTKSEDAQRIASTFSDAVAVAMEDIGVTRAAAIVGASEAIAIRSASDRIDGKAESDATGSQPQAAANASAFAFEMLARLEFEDAPTSGSEVSQSLYRLTADLYPAGPTDRSIWERAGGNLSMLQLSGTGQSMWWAALRQIEQGGGGSSISLQSLIAAMRSDHPNNSALSKWESVTRP